MTKRKPRSDDDAGDPPVAAATPVPGAMGAPPAGEGADTGDATGSGERSDADPATELGEAVAALEAQVAAETDKYLRLAAEYDNFRKRAVRERQEAESRGMAQLVKGILDALDDLGRFAHLDPSSTDTTTVVDGVELVERKLLKSLAGHGLELVSPLGEAFNPAFHEALTTMPAASPEEDHTVGQVFQVGYVFNGQLLRAARVVVKQWTGAATDGSSSFPS